VQQQEFARVAETYGDGTARLTPEENILFVNVPDAQLPAMLAEPIFAKFKVNPGRLLIWWPNLAVLTWPH
jgi:ferredoxin-nitrite reductase